MKKVILSVTILFFALLSSCLPAFSDNEKSLPSTPHIATSTSTTTPAQIIIPTTIPTLGNWRWTNVLVTFNKLAVVSSNEIWAIGNGGIIIHTNPESQAYYHRMFDYRGEYDFTRYDYLSSIEFVSENDGWLITYGGQIFHWDGTTWEITNVSYGTGTIGLSDIGFANTNTGWAVGCYKKNNSEFAFIMQWNGTTWNEMPLPNEITNGYCLNDIDVVSETDIWIIGESYQKAILLHGDGLQWQSVHLPSEFNTRKYSNALTAINSNVWIAGQNTVSHWNGLIWKTTELPIANFYSNNTSDAPFFIPHSPSILALAPDNVWVAGSSLFRWNGDNWIDANYTTTYDYIVDIKADSGNRIWALTTSGKIMRLFNNTK